MSFVDQQQQLNERIALAQNQQSSSSTSQRRRRSSADNHHGDFKHPFSHSHRAGGELSILLAVWLIKLA